MAAAQPDFVRAGFNKAIDFVKGPGGGNLVHPFDRFFHPRIHDGGRLHHIFDKMVQKQLEITANLQRCREVAFIEQLGRGSEEVEALKPRIDILHHAVFLNENVRMNLGTVILFLELAFGVAEIVVLMRKPDPVRMLPIEIGAAVDHRLCSGGLPAVPFSRRDIDDDPFLRLVNLVVHVKLAEALLDEHDRACITNSLTAILSRRKAVPLGKQDVGIYIVQVSSRVVHTDLLQVQWLYNATQQSLYSIEFIS